MRTGFRGVLPTDGHSAHESLGKESSGRLTAAGCWMHTRRGFDEALATASHPRVSQSLARIQVLYDMEDQAKTLPFDERRAVHERESRPLIQHLFTSWEETLPALRPSTTLAQALGYGVPRVLNSSYSVVTGQRNRFLPTTINSGFTTPASLPRIAGSFALRAQYVSGQATGKSSASINCGPLRACGGCA